MKRPQASVTAPQASALQPRADLSAAKLEALTAQQIECVTRLVSYEGDRIGILRQLKSGDALNPLHLKQQLAEFDGLVAGERAKLADLNKRIADVARETPQGSPAFRSIAEVTPPTRVFGVTPQESTAILTFVLLFPLVLACARIIWHRSTRPASTKLEKDRITCLEQAVDTVALEVERIGESQRFYAALMSERAEIPEVRR